MSAGVVIAGGGLAAQRCCEALRKRGYEGPIRVVGDETRPPYDRPPLSKGFLAGEIAESELMLRPADWHREHGVELLLGRSAVALDPRGRRLGLDGGERLPYEHLLIATGSRPRRLGSLGAFANVHTLRTVEDARALGARLAAGARLAIVGAGFVGLEVASTARSLGVEVTMIEALPLPLLRVLGPRLGQWFADLHAQEGVDVLLGARIAGVHGRRERAEEIELEGGRRVACDAVLVGVGVDPATQWLAGSGLPVDGVPVDAAGRTRVPGVYAAGDAARPFDPHAGAHVRSDHWEAAGRTAAAAAAAMLGAEPPAAPPPSFWTDQYGVRIQYLGHAAGADRVDIDGDPAARDFTAVLSRAGRPVAGLLVGRPRELPALRRLLFDPSRSQPERLAA